MKLKYTALGASNQKLEGVLDADSLEAAREELHKMGMSVVAIDEVSEEEATTVQSTEGSANETKEGIVTYYFLAKDPLGKEVNGTIDSREPYSAFKRLLTEYQFEVMDMYPQNALNPGLESFRGQFDEWRGQMEDEGIDLSKKKTIGGRGELEEGEKMSEEVVNEIDQFIINTKSVLEKHKIKYSDPLLREIDKTLGELEMVRASNNIKHITKICNDLYELVANPDKAPISDETQEDPDYENSISKLRSSGFVANPFQFLEGHKLQEKIPGFGKVQELFAGIRKAIGGKDKEEKAPKKKNMWLRKFSRSFRGKRTETGPRLSGIITKFFDYIAAPSPILRRARKQEMLKSFRAWKEARKQRKLQKGKSSPQNEDESVIPEGAEAENAPERQRRDFSPFFMELDSFVGWLLFFYIAFFFLVSFSIERNVGLPQSLVLKTLSSPLIVNISIFLIITHLSFTLKIRYFRSNFFGSLFLFFFILSLYTILMVNF